MVNIMFWTDNWIYDLSLVEVMNIPPHLHNHISASISDFLQDSIWFIL